MKRLILLSGLFIIIGVPAMAAAMAEDGGGSIGEGSALSSRLLNLTQN